MHSPNTVRREARRLRLGGRQLAWFSLGMLLFAVPVLAQSQQTPTSAAPTVSAGAPSKEQSQPQPASGSITGTIVDQTGTALAGAHLVLTRDENSGSQEATSDEAGQFFFVNVAPGTFRLTVSARGFVTQTLSGTLRGGQAYAVPAISLAVAGITTQVKVIPTAQIAEGQIKEQEKQRVLGVPNFYVSYVRDAAPLNVGQKFQLAWHSSIDPVNLAIVAGTAGIQQAVDQYHDYGQGAEGYGKRFGAAYGDVAISTFLGGAVLPSLFKQDPRFFFKENGTRKQRILYAIAASIMCKSDSGRWEPNYSGILGSLAAGGISNLYTPDQNRSDLAVTFEGTAIGIGATAGENILQEFVVPKFTRKKGPKPNATPGVDESSSQD